MALSKQRRQPCKQTRCAFGGLSPRSGARAAASAAPIGWASDGACNRCQLSPMRRRQRWRLLAQAGRAPQRKKRVCFLWYATWARLHLPLPAARVLAAGYQRVARIEFPHAQRLRRVRSPLPAAGSRVSSQLCVRSSRLAWVARASVLPGADPARLFCRRGRHTRWKCRRRTSRGA